MSKLPNFLIIGPPKCASTSLHYYLGQHPEVFVSHVKETNFFTHDYHKGLAFYSKYFSGAETAKAVGEATPSYFFLPFAIDRIKKDIPEAKLIITFRNPIERAFSHWLMFREAGIEKASFSDAIKINLKQMEYLDFIGDKGAELWDKRKQFTGNNEKWIRTYIQPGMYAENLDTIYKKFSKEQVYVIFLEDMKTYFCETIKNIFEFIGVDENFTISDIETKNFYFDKKYLRLIQKIAGMKNARYISNKLSDNIKNIFRQRSSAHTVPKISKEDRIFLENFFLADIKKLEGIVNRKLDHWLMHETGNIINH